MTAIYYFSTTFMLYGSLMWLLSPVECAKESQEFFELQKFYKDKDYSDFSEKYKAKLIYRFKIVPILIWYFLGLFTFQWIIFLVMLIVNIFILNPLTKLVKFSKLYIIIGWFYSLIQFAFGFFVIINHYHLQINFLALYERYF